MKFLKVRKVKTPTRGTSKSAGIDFYIPEDFQKRTLLWGQDVNIPSGIKVQIPKGFALIAMNKSGIATKVRLQVGACVIDEDYQGEIHLHVYNTGHSEVVLSPGLKLVQMLLVPVSYEGIEEVLSLEDLYPSISERGEGGFGSTGVV